MRKILPILFCTLSFASFGQWSNDPTENNIVCNSSSTTAKGDVVTVSDGAGGIFVAWSETRGATGSDIYIQRLSANGVQLFASEGVVVCNAASDQNNISMISDNAGGVILLWQDIRTSASSSQADIYMQRINASGSPQWAANGIPVVNSSANENGVSALAINATRFAVVWRDARNGNLDLYANYFLAADGSRVTPTDIEIVAQPNTQTRQVLTSDGSGGFIVAWEDPRISTSETDIFIQRVNSAGAIQWGANGKAAVTSSFNQLQPAITSDGNGGAVVVWTDNRISATDQNLFAQRFNASGDVLWAANGVNIVSATGNQNNAFIIPSSNNSTIIVWSDNRVSTTDRNIYAQKLNGNGEAQWEANGVGICTLTFNQPNAVSSLVIVPDGADGAIIAWDDNRANNTTTGLDIYAQRISGTGSIMWTANGAQVATRAGSNQRVPVMIPNDGNRAIIAFLDGRSGTANGSIYASQIFSDGTLPVSLLNFSGRRMNTTTQLQWEVSAETGIKNYEIQRGTTPAAFAAIGSVQSVQAGANKHLYQFNDMAPKLGSDNYYRLKIVETDGAFRYSNVVKIGFPKNAGAQIQLAPNPARSQVLLQLSGLEKANYSLRFINANGQTLLTKSVLVENQFDQVAITVSQLPAGIYRVVMVGADGEQVANLPLQKL